MPHQLSIKGKHVVLNEHNFLILKILNEVIVQYLQSKGCNLEQELTPTKLYGLSQKAPKIRQGVISPLILKLEEFTQKRYGSQEIILDEVLVELDPPAKVYCDAYIDYLTQHAKLDGLNSSQLEGEIISSSLVLMREILRRLITLALSTSHEETTICGEMAVAILKIFVSEVTKTQVLWIKTISRNNTISNLGKQFLTVEHKEWMKDLSRLVEALQLIQSNTEATFRTLKYLDTAKHMIIAHLIVELALKVDLHDLDESLIRTKLTEHENRLLIKADCLETHQSSNSYDTTKWSNRQEAIVKSIHIAIASEFNKKVLKQKRAEALYSLLNETNLLLNVITKLDSLNKTTGWIFIIAGVLKLDKLTGLIIEHGKKCAELLAVSDSSAIFKNTRALKELNQQNIILISNQLSDYARNAATVFKRLDEPVLMELLKKLIFSQLEELTKLEKILGYSLIDQEIYGIIFKSCSGLQQSGSGSSLSQPRSLSFKQRVSYILPFVGTQDETKMRVEKELEAVLYAKNAHNTSVLQQAIILYQWYSQQSLSSMHRFSHQYTAIETVNLLIATVEKGQAFTEIVFTNIVKQAFQNAREKQRNFYFWQQPKQYDAINNIGHFKAIEQYILNLIARHTAKEIANHEVIEFKV